MVVIGVSMRRVADVVVTGERELSSPKAADFGVASGRPSDASSRHVPERQISGQQPEIREAHKRDSIDGSSISSACALYLPCTLPYPRLVRAELSQCCPLS